MIGTLVHLLISLVRIRSIFCSCSHSHWTNFSFRLVPITAEWTEVVRNQSLPKAFTHTHTHTHTHTPALGKSNPRPLDFGSNALFATPRNPYTDSPHSHYLLDNVSLINQPLHIQLLPRTIPRMTWRNCSCRTMWFIWDAWQINNHLHGQWSVTGRARPMLCLGVNRSVKWRPQKLPRLLRNSKVSVASITTGDTSALCFTGWVHYVTGRNWHEWIVPLFIDIKTQCIRSHCVL